MSKKVRAYWFGDKLKYGDDRVPKAGITHEVKGQLALCSRGLHASSHPADALEFSSTTTLWLVELSGVVISGKDKKVANKRKYIKRIDATEVLMEYARWCAKRALKNWAHQPPQAVLDYLSSGDKKLRSAAESAAWSAARSAAEAAKCAAESAAWSAAESAAWSAAWSAAESAARCAAWSAAWSAARGKERKAQRRKFKQLVEEAFNAS